MAHSYCDFYHRHRHRPIHLNSFRKQVHLIVIIIINIYFIFHSTINGNLYAWATEVEQKKRRRTVRMNYKSNPFALNIIRGRTCMAQLIEVALAIIDNDVYTVCDASDGRCCSCDIWQRQQQAAAAPAPTTTKANNSWFNGWYGNEKWGELPVSLIDDNCLKSRTPSHISRIKSTTTTTATLMMVMISPSFLFKHSSLFR